MGRPRINPDKLSDGLYVKAVHVRLDEQMHRKLQSFAKEHKTSLGEAARIMIENGLEDD